MLKEVAVGFLLFCGISPSFSMNGWGDLLEEREIKYGTYSMQATVPKSFKDYQEALKESVEHVLCTYNKAKENKENVQDVKESVNETMKNFIAGALATGFWNAIHDGDEKEAEIYLLTALQNGILKISDSLKYSLNDMGIEYKKIAVSNIEDKDTQKAVEIFVKRLIGSNKKEEEPEGSIDELNNLVQRKQQELDVLKKKIEEQKIMYTPKTKQ